MTANHRYTPTDDPRKEQATSGQQPTGQQSPQQPPPTQRFQAGQGQTPQFGPQQTPPQQLQGGQQVQSGQQLGGTQQMQGGQPRQGQHPGTPQSSPFQGSSGIQQQPQVQQGQQSPTPGQQPATPPTAQGVPVSSQQPYGQPAGPRQRQQVPGPRQPLLKPMRVNEVITEDVVTAERDTPLRTVVAQMAEHEVGSVVVVEEDRPIGIITDRKVALALEELPDIAQRTAEELLHGDVFTADPSMSIFDAVQVMSDEGIRRLPIVDDNGALRGIVTLDDALVLLGGVVSEVADTVQSQSPRL